MVATLQQEFQALRVDREQERETAKNLQKFLAGQVRELRTASAQQPSGSVSAQEVGSAPMVRPDSGRTTTRSDRSSASGNAADATRQKPDVRSSDEIFAAQFQATLQAFAADRVSKNPMGKAVKISEPVVNVKAEPMSGSRTSATGKAELSSGTKSTAPGKSAKRHTSERSGSSKKSSTSGKGKRTKKSSGKSSDPSDSDPSSDSSKSDSDSDSSNSSSFEDVVPNVHTTPGPGGSLFTFRPYVNASTLEDFNEKASLATRIRWLERFQSFAVQGGWSDKVKIYEMKLKLPAAVRNWRSNLNPNVRRKWKKFLKEFRDMYCKAKTSDSERYYTMIQKKAETPLEFYYRLNKVADKAGIEFDASSKQRERHLKVFTKKLLDSRLRTTLQGQRLRRLKDLDISRDGESWMAATDF
uniref:Retrotransposon gag domain-containing protein n=1 Tax=Phytophthora ramorum TaxID=164328 RepID=H3H859_PHYRM